MQSISCCSQPYSDAVETYVTPVDPPLPNRASVKISRLTQQVFSSTRSSALRRRSAKQQLESCLKEIARMYRITPEQTDLLDELKERVAVAKTWVDLGLDTSVIDTDFDSVRFLVKQRVIFSIVGLANTSSFGENQIHIESGKLFIRVDGQFVPVSMLLDRFEYVRADLQYREKETNLPWNYVLPCGFTQIDRCTSPKLIPTTHLSPTEMHQLLKHAQAFEGLSFSEDSPPVGVLQIMTNPRKRIKKDSFLFDGIESLTPVHVGFRFIDEQGRVFSSGFASTPEEDLYCSGKRNALASINGVPGITDYEEFRPHEGRRITSIPLSKKNCENLMDELQKMRTQGVRFNILTQNCARMVSRLLQVTGVEVDHRETAYQCLYHFLPSLASFPKLQLLVRKILSISQAISERIVAPSIREHISLPRKIVSLALRPIQCLANVPINLLLMAFGAHKGSPLKPNMYGESPDDRMGSFFAIISSFKDIFSVPVVYHSGPIIAWQDRQKTTLHYRYTIPSMNILPSEGHRVPDSKKRPFARFNPRHRQPLRIHPSLSIRRIRILRHRKN